MSVVAFHAFPAFLPGGFVGVDVFFVISGFLITGILLKEHATGTFSVMRFYERRVRRFFPALSVVLVATVLGAFAFGYPSTVASMAKHGAAGRVLGHQRRSLARGWLLDTGSHLKPLLHLWSLGVEEQFYLVWPLLLAAVVRPWCPALRCSPVERLVAVGKRVVLVIDVPELPFEPKHCFVRPRIRLAEQHCRVSASEVAFRQSAIRAIIADIAAMHPTTVAVADPTAVLCDLDFCGAGTAVAPTYRDSHHLSLHGSVIAAKVILQAERRLLP